MAQGTWCPARQCGTSQGRECRNQPEPLPKYRGLAFPGPEDMLLLALAPGHSAPCPLMGRGWTTHGILSRSFHLHCELRMVEAKRWAGSAVREWPCEQEDTGSLVNQAGAPRTPPGDPGEEALSLEPARLVHNLFSGLPKAVSFDAHTSVRSRKESHGVAWGPHPPEPSRSFQSHLLEAPRTCVVLECPTAG